MRAAVLKRMIVPGALVLGSIVLAMLIALGADRAVGQWVEDPRLTAGLLFPPQVEVAYKMYEYSFTARTNALGVRDEPYDPRKRPRVLVAAVGDSTTFGQGVEIEDTWVQRVEKSLRAKGLDVEILNFGMPGSSPPAYASLAEESLPVLKPDLVLVDLLQSNDIMIDVGREYYTPTYRRDPPLRTVLREWFPNLTDLAYRERAQQSATLDTRTQGRWNMIQHKYAGDFRKMYETFDAPTLETFGRLPVALQQALHHGEVRPQFALHCSKFIVNNARARRSLELESPEMQQRINFAAECLVRVKQAIAPWGGKAVVLSLPSMMDNDPFATKVWIDFFGPSLLPRLDDSWADDPIHETARRAGLPSHDVTDAFREAARREPLFFTVDTHMNEAGNAAYAELIEPVIERYVREIGGYPPA